MALIAGEIDLAVPDIDLVHVEQFLAQTHEIHNNSRTSSEEKGYKQRNDREYPWQRRVLEYLNKPIYDYSLFPEINKIIEMTHTLPIVPATRTSLMLYQNSQKTYDFNWHFDVDTEQGFRICFNLNTEIPFVQLAKLKPEFEYVSKTFERIENHMVDESNQHEIYPTRKNTVFLLNRRNYPHKVPVFERSSQRCVIIVSGKITDPNFNFLQRIDDELHT